MEKDRSSRLLAIIALVIGVAGLSLGFAAFSTTLTITSSADVKVSQADSFKVLFSSSKTALATESVTGSVTGSGATAGSATIDNSTVTAPKITGLAAHFTAPGQSVKYTFYVANTGKLPAYLKSIVYGNASGGTTFSKCTAGTGTTAALVTSACSSITVTTSVQGVTATSSNNAITGKSIAADGYEEVTVTIAYAANGQVTDGDFTVAFGDISLGYSSADA